MNLATAFNVMVKAPACKAVGVAIAAAAAKAALQYGTTHGYAPLREKILARATKLDAIKAESVSLSANDVVVTTGSQQLLYMLGELLLDPGDIVITEAPSYFVYHGTLT